MAKAKTSAERPGGADSVERLAATVESLTQQLAEATEALRTQTKRQAELAQQVEALWRTIEESREDFQWAVRNDKLGSGSGDRWRPVMHITSMPKDPCAPDFGARVNRLKPEDLPPDETAAPASPQVATAHGQLF